MESEGAGLLLAGVRVLVVDHYQPLRWLKAHLLRKTGAEVLEAATGAEALEILDTAKVDVALLDYSLWDMPAAELRRRMQEKQAAAAVPVIYFVASEADQRPPDGEAFLPEPPDADKLATTILMVLGRAT